MYKDGARNGDDLRDVKKSRVGAEQRRTGGRVLHCGGVVPGGGMW